MSKIQKGEVKNPYGRAGKPQQVNTDGWSNILTSLGNKNDTSSYTKYSYDHRLDFRTLDNLYSGDGIAKRIVDIIVDDATRDFIEVEEALEKEYDRIKLKPTLVKCLKDARLYGGSICVALVDDGGEFDEPINYNRVKQLVKLRNYDRWQVSWTTTDLNNDPLSPNYGMPEYYQISPLVGMPYRVHVSRVFRFDGIQTPERIKVNNNGWCDSVLQGCFNGLMQYGSVAGYSANIVRDFIQVVLGVKGLSEMLRQGNDDLVTKRATIIDMTRSVANTVFIDSDGETYDKKASSVSGLDTLWDKFKEKLSSETGIPQVKLFGEGIGGLSNGSNDTRSWYDVVQAYRDAECPPFIEWVNKILEAQIIWKNRPKSLEYSFPSLWSPSEAEYADIKLKTAQTDAIYFGVQAVDPEYIYHLRHQNGYFRTEIKYDEEDYMEWLASRVGKEIMEGEVVDLNPSNNIEEPFKETETSINPKTALNGAQVTALLDIVNRVTIGEITKGTAKSIMMSAFPIEEKQADELLSEVKEGSNNTDSVTDEEYKVNKILEEYIPVDIVDAIKGL